VHIYYLIDASLAEGVEGEENFEEEEYFDQFANQGKLSHDTIIDPWFTMHVLQSLLLSRENNGVRWKIV